MIAPGPSWELRCGDYRKVLSDVGQVDAVICDPPYSERTHVGSDAVATSATSADATERRSLGYSFWTPVEIAEIVARFAGVRGWFCAFTDSDLFNHWRGAFEDAGRYSFSPVPVLHHKPRLGGDGPGSGAVYLCVSRPRTKEFMSWGSLPCWYHSKPEKASVMGAKPTSLMRAIIRDYSRPGDLVCDPCAGGATTLRAAVLEGRRAIGAELDPATYAKAVDRLRGWGDMQSQVQPNLLEGLVGK